MSRQKLVCYLFKEDITSIEDMEIFKNGRVPDDYTEILLNSTVNLNSTLIKGFLKRDSIRKPEWVDRLSPLFDFPEGLINSSCSVLFFVKAENRVIAYTMGHANHVINKAKIEHDFGVKVVLNEIDQTKVRSVDTRIMTMNPHQKMDASSSYGQLRDFDFDNRQEFINSISGITTNGALNANVLFGNSSLRLSSEIDITNIIPFSNKLIESYSKTDYRAKFDFYDKLKIIKDPDIYDEFHRQIIESFRELNSERITLLYPNILDSDPTYSYRIFIGRRNKYVDDINLEILFDFCREKSITISNKLDLESISIKLLNEQNEVVNEYSLWDYLVYEFDYHDKKYLYSSLMLFEIDADYFNEIINDIDQYEISSLTDVSITVPAIGYTHAVNSKNKPTIKIEDEGDYNIRFAGINPGKCICLDKNNYRNFPGRRRDQVESCDVLTKDKEFICVKTYKKSSAVLSHLFMQAVVSADLLVNLQDYRAKINAEVAKHQYFGQNFIGLDNLDRTQITFVYAICMDKEGRLARNLPFFSKISLRAAISQLKMFNFNVGLLRIQFQETN